MRITANNAFVTYITYVLLFQYRRLFHFVHLESDNLLSFFHCYISTNDVDRGGMTSASSSARDLVRIFQNVRMRPVFIQVWFMVPEHERYIKIFYTG